MLNSLTLLRAMNGIYEEDVVMAGNSYYVKNFDYPEKPLKYKHIRRISD